MTAISDLPDSRNPAHAVSSSIAPEPFNAIVVYLMLFESADVKTRGKRIDNSPTGKEIGSRKVQEYLVQRYYRYPLARLDD